MNKKILITSAILGLLVGIALIIPKFVDVNSYRSKIETETSNAIGRKVTIGGDMSLRIFPTPRISVADVHIANDPAGSDKEFLTVDEASVSVELMPLLSKNINISGINIKKPQIRLQKLSKNSSNWDFISNVASKQTASTTQTSTSEKSKYSIQNVVITDGTIIYRDGRDITTINKVNLDFSASSLSGPFKVNGDLELNDKKMTFKVKAEQWNEGKPLPLTGQLEFDECKASFDGKIDLDSKTYQGKLDANIPATKAKEYGAPIAYDTSVTGGIAVDTKRVVFNNFVINYTDCYAKLSGELVLASKFYQGPVELKLAGNKVRALGAPIPSDVVLKGKLMAGPASISFSDLIISMDQVKANGIINLSLQGDRAYRLNFSNLPGNTSVIFAGAMSSVNQGKLNLQSDNVRKLVNWLKLDAIEIPELFMGQLKINSNFQQNDSVTRLTNLNLAVGRSDVAGNVMFSKDAYEIDLKTDNIGNWLQMLGSDSKAKGAVQVKGKFYGPLNNMQVNATTFIAGGKMDVSGTVKMQEKDTNFDVRLGLSQPDLSGLIKNLTGDPLPIHLRNFKLNSKLTGKLAKINFSELNMSFSNGSGSTQIAGNGFYDKTGKKPMLAMEASVGDLNVNSMLAENSGPGNFKVTLAKMKIGDSGRSKFTGWSVEPINFALLNALNAKLNIKTNSIRYGEYTVDKVTLPIDIKDGVMRIPSINGGIFGGKATGSITVGPGSIKALVNFSGAQLRSLMKKDSQYNVNGGILDTTLDVHMKGYSQKALISSMGGKLDLHVSAGELVGMDLQALVNRLNHLNNPAELLSLMQGATSNGKTPFNSIQGNFIIEKGVASTNNLTMDAPVGTGHVTGIVNLPSYVMDMLATMQLNGINGLPPFKMRLRGPIDAPAQELSTGNLSSFIFKKIGSGVIGDILRNKGIPLPIPGANDGDAQGGAKSESLPKPKDLVGGLLKGLLKQK